MTDAPDSAVRAYVDQHAEQFVAELGEWIRIPSISNDPAHAGDVRRSAQYIADRLRGTGFPTVEIWETGGGPSVFAHWPSADPDAVTVLVYGHHDVQPVDPGGWDTAPFEPTLRGDLLFGRGAADDKGQVYFHLLGLRAHLAATGRDAPAVNLKLLVEGEEEAGSPNFAALLRERARELACDVVVVSDTGIWTKDVPTICTSMRGLVDCAVTFHGPATDIHSGTFGGAVPNPATELARVIAALHDDDRRVTIPGFYDDVLELGEKERAILARLPFDEQTWLASATSRAPVGEAGYSTLERIWARPTAEVNGLLAGKPGRGTNTIVPAEARAKLSFRLVAAQDPAAIRDAVEVWFAAHAPEGIEYELEFAGEGVRPCMTPLDHPALRAVTRALSRAFQTEVLYTRGGGSGPEADLQDILEAPVVFLGVSPVDNDGKHGPNERADIPLMLKGAEAAAYLWEELPRTREVAA